MGPSSPCTSTTVRRLPSRFVLAATCSVLNKVFDLAPPLLIGMAVDLVVKREESFLAGLEKGNRLPSVPEVQAAAAATYVIPMNQGWESYVHGIVQYNDEDGPSNVREAPLDFTDNGSRLTYFVALENNERKRSLFQRGFDVSYAVR